MDEYNFDDEWFDGEFEDEEVSETILAMAEMINEDESRTSVLNLERMKQFQLAYGLTKTMTKGSGAKVAFKPHSPYQSVGVISIVGKNIRFLHTEYFKPISKLASNIEIYPRTDGRVQINMTFHGLTVPIE